MSFVQKLEALYENRHQETLNITRNQARDSNRYQRLIFWVGIGSLITSVIAIVASAVVAVYVANISAQ